MPVKTCVICGEDFLAEGLGNGARKTCSDECSSVNKTNWTRRQFESAEYRERMNKRQRERRRERLATDPSYRQREREYNRQRMRDPDKRAAAISQCARANGIRREEVRAERAMAAFHSAIAILSCEPVELRVCSECGAEITNPRRRLVCSSECARDRGNRMTSERRLMPAKEIVCVVCGETAFFNGRGSFHRKTCSTDCSKTLRLSKKASWNREYRQKRAMAAFHDAKEILKKEPIK